MTAEVCATPYLIWSRIGRGVPSGHSNLPPLVHRGSLSLKVPEPEQGGKVVKSGAELSGQSGGTPPGWQDILEPSLQGVLN